VDLLPRRIAADRRLRLRSASGPRGPLPAAMQEPTAEPLDASWQPVPPASSSAGMAEEVAPSTAARLRPSPTARLRQPQPQRTPFAAAGGGAAGGMHWPLRSSPQPTPSPSEQAQMAHIARLQAALLATQEAHAAATAQIAAQRYAQQQPSVIYATPAAWQRRREVLMNEPTPQTLGGVDRLSTTPDGELLLDAGPQLQLPSLHEPKASSESSSSNNGERRRSAPSSLERRSSMPHSAKRRSQGHQRSVSSLPLTPHSGGRDGSSSTSPALGATSTAEVAASLHEMKAILSEFETAKARDHAKLRQLKKMKLEIEAAKAHAHQQSRIQRTFLHISQGLIVAFVAILLYYNYVMLAPHVHALFWAGLFWMLLDAPQRVLLRAFHVLDTRFLNKYARSLEVFAACVTLVLGVLSAGRLSALLLLGVSFLVLTFFLYGNRHTVTAVILLLLIMLLIAFPLFFLAKTCVMESAEIAARLRQFIEGNQEFQHILEDFSTSATFLWLQRYCRRWGYEIPVADVAKLRELILKSIVQFADQLTTVLTGVYGLLSNMTNLVVGLATFASCLYFLLAASRDFAGTLTWLSPFREEDNVKLVSTMKKSVERIFLCSFSVGALHVIVSYVSFSMCGIDLCLILSFLSGFAAMLPVFSSWVVWLPACLALLIAGKTVSAAALAGVQLSLLFYVDPLIMRGIPGDSYVIGMSIVFAVYAFGAAGVLLGPLLAAMTFTFLEIYREYLSMPILTTQNAPPPPPPQATRARALQRQGSGGQPSAAGLQFLNSLDPLGDAFFTTFQPPQQHQPQSASLLSLMGDGQIQSARQGASVPPVHSTPSSRRSLGESLASPLAANPSRALRFNTPSGLSGGGGAGSTTGVSPMPTPSRRPRPSLGTSGASVVGDGGPSATPHAIHEEHEGEEEEDDEEEEVEVEAGHDDEAGPPLEQHAPDHSDAEGADDTINADDSIAPTPTLHRPASVLSPLSLLSPLSMSSPSPLSPSPLPSFGDTAAVSYSSTAGNGHNDAMHRTSSSISSSSTALRAARVQSTHQRLIEQLEAQLEQLRQEEQLQQQQPDGQEQLPVAMEATEAVADAAEKHTTAQEEQDADPAPEESSMRQRAARAGQRSTDIDS